MADQLMQLTFPKAPGQRMCDKTEATVSFTTKPEVTGSGSNLETGTTQQLD